MLNNLSLKDISGGINLVDIGAGGNLSSYWSAIEHLINLYAFDPNKEECQRLTQLTNNFASANYLPFAVAGENRQFTLFETKNDRCWSLLEPNQEWLSRFSFHDLFKLEATSVIQALTLEEIEQLANVDTDVIKCDTQGLELPILNAASSKVERAFLIETETGFVENYVGETTFRQISEFMERNHFLLFDINTDHRIARNNHFSETTRNQEILWCEAIWLKDYVAIEREQGIDIERGKALKALTLCANHGCIDYGFELATLFFDKGLITDSEYQSLKDRKSWILEKQKSRTMVYDFFSTVLVYILPSRYSRNTAQLLTDVSQKPHPVKKWLKNSLSQTE